MTSVKCVEHRFQGQMIDLCGIGKERKAGKADGEKLEGKKLLVVLMKLKNRCGGSKRVRGLRPEIGWTEAPRFRGVWSWVVAQSKGCGAGVTEV